MAEKFSYDFRLKVVQEALKPENRNSVSYIAQKYGIGDRTLRKWIKYYNQFGEESLRPYWRDTSKDQRIKELERENAKLKEEAEILKKAAAFLADAMRK